MTTITLNHRPHAHRHESRLASLVATFGAWRRRRQERHQLARELASMSDTECHDLGITRADFHAILNGTYRR